MEDVQVTRCEECPFYSEAYDQEYCSQEGNPEKRYPEGDPWDQILKKKDIPDDCPLKIREVTIKLAI